VDADREGDSSCGNYTWPSCCAWPGLLHGAAKVRNILFGHDRRIQIADFSRVCLRTGEAEPFSGEKLVPTADVSPFASLLFEIAFGGPAALPISAARCLFLSAAVPAFVSRMIENARSPKSNGGLSFVYIVAR
jgi:hypothetical protein